MPRRVSQQSNGEGTAPPTFCDTRALVKTALGSRVSRTPPVTSLCPERNLVVECATMSIPNSSGCCNTGEAKVLSQTVGMLRAVARAEMAAKSVIFSRGFE